MSEVAPPIPLDDRERAFHAALGAAVEFYNDLVADLRKQITEANKDRDRWQAKYQARRYDKPNVEEARGG